MLNTTELTNVLYIEFSVVVSYSDQWCRILWLVKPYICDLISLCSLYGGDISHYAADCTNDQIPCETVNRLISNIANDQRYLDNTFKRETCNRVLPAFIIRVLADECK